MSSYCTQIEIISFCYIENNNQHKKEKRGDILNEEKRISY
ncbi:hypothetical protein Xbed_02838 [Xenorhabdus beddingii]|uniref:Uncharacterized protein n=1 Tax=Xenorhabdus beddingii TaxID=40578 RepID=A0A1Y2SM22_9GAMM|nr:hypothetical protein Xbed_02838 [Xenorhabdus beddingii]